MSISINRKNRLFPYLITILFTALITACGGDGGDPEPGGNPTTPPPASVTRTLTGTAATGAAVEGRVTIIAADGTELFTDTDATGAYSINLEGKPGPYLIRIATNNIALPFLYSYATNSGVANITQFTSLALVLAFQNLGDAFDNWANTLSTWDRATLEQALATINANFTGDLTAAGVVQPLTYDLITTPFDANQTGIDAFLDNYTVTVDYASNNYSITINGTGGNYEFDPNINTDGYYIGAWFIPEGGTEVWELTLIITLDGVQQNPNATPTPYLTTAIPWSRERFEEIFWGELSEPTIQSVDCSQPPVTDCQLDLRVSQFDTNYNVMGNGGIGTQIDASVDYNWNLSVTAQGVVNGIPFSQNYSESESWSYVWRWNRVS